MADNNNWPHSLLQTKQILALHSNTEPARVIETLKHQDPNLIRRVACSIFQEWLSTRARAMVTFWAGINYCRISDALKEVSDREISELIGQFRLLIIGIELLSYIIELILNTSVKGYSYKLLTDWLLTINGMSFHPLPCFAYRLSRGASYKVSDDVHRLRRLDKGC